MSVARIWIVDDDTDDIELISQAFSKISLQIKPFGTHEALTIPEILHNTPDKELPELLLIDINMPLISGKDLLVKIRQQPKFNSVPIAIFTTSNSVLEKQECYRKGANCFITKPSSYIELENLCLSLYRLFLER